MTLETNFSFHAFKRVRDRLSISHCDLAEILDSNLALNIGQEGKYPNRAHWLFYSHLDKMCFVAVQDIKTKTVITVLPIDYHENICWVVSIDAQSQARDMLTKTDKLVSHSIEPKVLSPTVFRVSARICSEDQSFMKTLNLGSWPRTPSVNNIVNLVQDNNFVNEVNERIAMKISTIEGASSKFVEYILIRIGNKGVPAIFSVSDILNSGD